MTGNDKVLHDYYLTSQFASMPLLPIDVVGVAACEPQMLRDQSARGLKFTTTQLSFHALRSLLATGLT